MKSFILLAAILLMVNFCFSQVSVNTDGSQPDNSSMLDVKSGNKGVLISRMDSSSRKGIPAPATGLMVFDTDTKSFWFYAGGWNEINGTNQNVGFAVTVKTSLSVSNSAVVFDSLAYNYGNGFIYSAPFVSYFQVPYTGFYHFDILTTVVQSPASFYQISLYKTTAGISTRPMTGIIRPLSTFPEAHGYSTNLFLQKNDLIRLWLEGGNTTINGPDVTRFSGYRIF